MNCPNCNEDMIDRGYEKLCLGCELAGPRTTLERLAKRLTTASVPVPELRAMADRWDNDPSYQDAETIIELRAACDEAEERGRHG